VRQIARVEVRLDDCAKTTLVAQRIRERRLPPRVLFMSGAVSPRSAKALPGPLLQKPFSPAELFRRVQEVLQA